MSEIKFIGYARSSITTRRGEVLNGYNLYFLDKLRNGTGLYGTSKFVTDDRLGDLGGLPELDKSYDVEWDRWGNFDLLAPI